MDVDRHVVTRRRPKVDLPLKEFDLLEMLLRNAGRVLTRMQLIDRVWGADYVGDTKTLDVHVKRLRAKIEPDPGAPRLPGDGPRPGLQVRAVNPGVVGHVCEGRDPSWGTALRRTGSVYEAQAQ